MAHIRAFGEIDIPEVADLHARVFRPAARPTERERASHRAYFSCVFLENPSHEPTLPSLVYQQDDGRIAGFLGVVPRRMWLHGQRLQAAISSQFVVDPASHSALVAVQLAKAFLDGPQDLSISDEATDTSRRIWEGLGGTTALLHSIYWTRALRPAQLAVSLMRNRAGLAALAVAAGPASRLVDALATGLRRSQLYQAPPTSVGGELQSGSLLPRLPEFASRKSLRVEYDNRTLDWLMARAAARRSDGHLHKGIINDDRGLIGWYVYHLDRDRQADVLQVAATPASIGEVLDHLFYHAWQQGATAATGRLDPRFMQAFSDKLCLFHRRGPWVLVSARQPELLEPFQNGDAWFSRFDGEWCLGF
jgi:hypothetical protein